MVNLGGSYTSYQKGEKNYIHKMSLVGYANTCKRYLLQRQHILWNRPRFQLLKKMKKPNLVRISKPG